MLIHMFNDISTVATYTFSMTLDVTATSEELNSTTQAHADLKQDLESQVTLIHFHVYSNKLILHCLLLSVTLICSLV